MIIDELLGSQCIMHAFDNSHGNTSTDAHTDQSLLNSDALVHCFCFYTELGKTE